MMQGFLVFLEYTLIYKFFGLDSFWSTFCQMKLKEHETVRKRYLK